MRILAETQSMTSHPDGTEVQVKVVGPKAFPESGKEFRARAQALISAGPVGPTARSVESVTMGELEGFTDVEDVIVRDDDSFLKGLIPSGLDLPDMATTEARLYTIVVKE